MEAVWRAVDRQRIYTDHPALQSLWAYSHREKGGVIMSKLTIEERRIVVEAMRGYPAGINRKSWGKSEEFFFDSPDGNCPKNNSQVERLTDEILLEHG